MIKVVELFSGIGSQAKAFERLSKKRNIEIKILNTCEWDVHAIVAYDYIHNGPSLYDSVINMSRDELLQRMLGFSLSNDGKNPLKKATLKSFSTEMLKIVYSSILKTKNLISVKDVKGEDIPNDVTVMTYSFPCQDLSNVGALHGYNKGIDKEYHTRSNLLWEVERILIERKNKGLDLPKFLLLENVTALEAERHSKNFNEWKNQLSNLGYTNQVYRLYAPDFGIPQNRKRLLMLSVFLGGDLEKERVVKGYFDHHDLNNVDYVRSLNINHKHLESFLRLDYQNEDLYAEACLSQPNNTGSRQTIWHNNCQILTENNVLNPIVQTITTKQDRHPNSGNLYFDPPNDRARYRFLTPRECMLLMGFDERDYEVLKESNFESRKNSLFFSRDKIYKLAGNSIVVNILESIFDQVIDLNKLINNG